MNGIAAGTSGTSGAAGIAGTSGTARFSADRTHFWPPDDALTEAARQIRARLGDWPAAREMWRICVVPADGARSASDALNVLNTLNAPDTSGRGDLIVVTDAGWYRDALCERQGQPVPQPESESAQQTHSIGLCVQQTQQAQQVRPAQSIPLAGSTQQMPPPQWTELTQPAQWMRPAQQLKLAQPVQRDSAQQTQPAQWARPAQQLEPAQPVQRDSAQQTQPAQWARPTQQLEPAQPVQRESAQQTQPAQWTRPAQQLEPAQPVQRDSAQQTQPTQWTRPAQQLEPAQPAQWRQWMAHGAAVIDATTAGRATLYQGSERYALESSPTKPAKTWLAALAAFLDCGFAPHDALTLALAWRDDAECHDTEYRDARHSAGRDSGRPADREHDDRKHDGNPSADSQRHDDERADNGPDDGGERSQCDDQSAGNESTGNERDRNGHDEHDHNDRGHDGNPLADSQCHSDERADNGPDGGERNQCNDQSAGNEHDRNDDHDHDHDHDHNHNHNHNDHHCNERRHNHDSHNVKHHRRSPPPATWPTDLTRFPRIADLPPAPAQPFARCPAKLGLYPVLPSADWVERVLECGVKSVQLRSKQPKSAALQREIERCVEAGRRHNARVFINDHWREALAAGAYGVHLGQEDVREADLAALNAAGLRLGLSTHGYYEMLRALHFRPSYIALGAIFPTTTKTMPTAPQGLARLARYVKLLDGIVPLVAIGGIDATVLPDVLATGAGSAAVVRAVTEADNPAAAIASLQRLFIR